MSHFHPKWVVGRRITQVDMNAFDDGRGGTAHAPVVYLDNGARMTFVTEETETGEYGTDILYYPPPK